MTVSKLTWNAVLAWRMRRNFLTEPASSMTEVSEQLIGVQAQVMSCAEVALCLRSKNTTPTKVRDALWKSRSLVKTWTARGTLHLHAPRDLSLFIAAMSMRGEYWAKPSWERYHGVTAKEMAVILEGLPQALGDECQTREELAASLADVTGKPKVAEKIMSSWGATIKPAAFHGMLCFGPNKSRNVTFVHPDVWLGEIEIVDGDAALSELLVRYIETYGPATKDDFTRWLGVEPKVSRRAFLSAEDSLVRVSVEGTDAFATESVLEQTRSRTSNKAVHLLPAYDPYVVGVLKNLAPLLPDPDLRSSVSRTAGRIAPTVVVDGHIVGVWTSKRRAKAVDIDVEYFTDVPSSVSKVVSLRVDQMSELMSTVPDPEVDGED